MDSFDPSLLLLFIYLKTAIIIKAVLEKKKKKKKKNKNKKSVGREKKKKKKMTSSGIELRIGNKYRVGRKIGSGSFGDIYLGRPLFVVLFSLVWSNSLSLVDEVKLYITKCEMRRRRKDPDRERCEIGTAEETRE